MITLTPEKPNDVACTTNDLDVGSPCGTRDSDPELNMRTQTHSIGGLQTRTQISPMGTVCMFWLLD